MMLNKLIAIRGVGMKNIKEILNKVEKGELTSKNAADLIRDLSHIDYRPKYAKKIKIRIHDRENNRKIPLPAIPIWVIEKIVLIGARLTNNFNKKEIIYQVKSNGNDKNELSKNDIETLKKERSKIETKDLKALFSVLRHMPPCRLVDIDDKDALVEIYMI